MSLKTTCLLFGCLITISIVGQERIKAEFGKPSQTEINMTTYSLDPTASGVVTFDKGKYYFKVIDNKIKIVKEVHRKIKVLDVKNFDYATIKLNYHQGENLHEEISGLKAITHNGIQQNYVQNTDIFDTKQDEVNNQIAFTFPNIKNGSILEYKYTKTSNNPYYLTGWYFQDRIPVMYSELDIKIPGNYVYNAVLIGNHKLGINRVFRDGSCFKFPNMDRLADCSAGIYAMFDIPAFKSEEYMLSESNYIAMLKYEWQSFTDFYGNTTTLTKTWEDVDEEFRTSKGMGKQLNYKSFFKNALPDEILNDTDPLSRAKKVYSFIQDRFNWNGKYEVFGKNRVKEAFNENAGSASEINLSLINALSAAELDAKLVLMSTRENGLPSQIYPVLTDFNYALALLEIGDQKITLDASDKFTPFGMLPFRALNIQGRVMDFNKGSYWWQIEPHEKNVYYTNTKIGLDEDGILNGQVSEITMGYAAVDKRRNMASESATSLVEVKEEQLPDFLISDYKVEGLEAIDGQLKESYTIELDSDETSDNMLVNPHFLQRLFKENPFKLNNRTYPVDFGYPINSTYMFSLDIPDGYQVKELPQNRVSNLGDAADYSVTYGQRGNAINMRFSLKVNQYRYAPQDYKALKEFFGSIATVISNDILILEKI